MPIISSSQITITDLNDAIVGGVKPSSPSVGTLWIEDIANGPDKLWRWSGTAWELQTLSLLGLDPDTFEVITTLDEILDNITSDGIITVSERGDINDTLIKIVGMILTDSTDLPTVLEIDTIIKKGELYSIRQEAIKVGIVSGHSKYADYTALETAYNTLRTYLNAMSPRPWNVTLDSNITIVPNTWRTNWLNYYNAYSTLEATITSILKDNDDSNGSRIDEIAADNKLTPVEKYDTKLEWDIIVAEKPTLEAQATVYGITTEKTDFVNAYNTLSTYITPLLANLNVTSDIVGTTFRTNFKNYFDKKALLLKKITDFSYDKFAEIANDNKLSAGEKQAVKREWDIITSEKPIIELQAAVYNITTEKTNYTNAYNDLNTYLTPLLAVLTVTSDIDGPTFRTKFINYYTTKATLLSMISGLINDKFEDMANDNILNPAEKQVVLKEWNVIKEEQPYIELQGRTYQITTGEVENYVTAFQALQTYVEPLLLNMNVSSDVIGTEFRSKFLDYYQTKTFLNQKIWDEMFKITTDEIALKVAQETYVTDVTNPDTGLLTRMNSAEIKIDAKNIISTVMQSTEYKGDIAGIKEDLSTVTQTATDWQASFKTGSGVNLLFNSVGYAGLDFWTVTGTANKVTSNEIKDLKEKGAGNGFRLTGGTIKQVVTTSNAEDLSYTVSVIVSKGTAGTGYLKIYDGTTTKTQNFVSGTEYKYQKFSLTINPAGNTFTVELNGDAASNIIFTSVMANIGKFPLMWSHAPGEVYNTSVLMDINGIRVSSNTYEGHTVMSPQEFAGYAKVNTSSGPVMKRVFTLNAGTTEVFKLDAEAEIIMAPLKILKVQTASYNGWAFVPGS